MPIYCRSRVRSLQSEPRKTSPIEIRRKDPSLKNKEDPSIKTDLKTTPKATRTTRRSSTDRITRARARIRRNIATDKKRRGKTKNTTRKKSITSRKWRRMKNSSRKPQMIDRRTKKLFKTQMIYFKCRTKRKSFAPQSRDSLEMTPWTVKLQT